MTTAQETSLMQETKVGLAEAARILPPHRNGRPVHVSCLMRWITRGVKTPTGVVYLEALRLGGRWFTSTEAITRFALRQTPRQGGANQLPRSVAIRRRASEQAARKLEQLGI